MLFCLWQHPYTSKNCLKSLVAMKIWDDHEKTVGSKAWTHDLLIIGRQSHNHNVTIIAEKELWCVKSQHSNLVGFFQVRECLSQLAASTEDETQWKYLNYQVLLCIRNNDIKVCLGSKNLPCWPLTLLALLFCLNSSSFLSDNVYLSSMQ